MKKREIIRERKEINEYGVEYIHSLKKEYNVTSLGTEYDVNYTVSSYAFIDGHCGGGYYRSYKRLANAMKDSYVEQYLKGEN